MKNGTNGGNSKNFFTPKEAADYIGVSTNTFYKWLRKPQTRGGPPVRKFGLNCYRLPKEKFIKWANAGTGD
ncbi:MAG: helix-turn-helix domain-containing protein [Hyphomicrobium sp.]|jgi:excisionase family DNA binding protein